MMRKKKQLHRLSIQVSFFVRIFFFRLHKVNCLIKFIIKKVEPSEPSSVCQTTNEAEKINSDISSSQNLARKVVEVITRDFSDDLEAPEEKFVKNLNDYIQTSTSKPMDDKDKSPEKLENSPRQSGKLKTIILFNC